MCLMVWIKKFACPAMYVVVLAKVFNCHRGILHVPPWNSHPEPALPGKIKLLRTVPQHDVVLAPLIWANVKPVHGKFLLRLAREAPVILVLFGVKVNVSVCDIGKSRLEEPGNMALHALHIVGNIRKP